MVFTDDLPTDSVLRRHALTERNRILGLPPTDAVLRRHYAQWQAVLQGGRTAGAPLRSAPPAALPRPLPPVAAAPATAVRSAVHPPVQSVAVTAPVPGGRPEAAPKPAAGGLLGWLRRLFGG